MRIPFVVRTNQPVPEELGPEYEEAGTNAGANARKVFAKSCCSELSPALIAGVCRPFYP